MIEEQLPLLDESFAIIGSAPRSVCHNGESFLLHPVVHLHIFRNGELLLQKRSMSKEIQPGKWDTCVGGHVAYGEDIRDALLREASEEIGFDASEARFFKRYVFKSPIERELVNIFISRVDNAFQITASNDEVDELRFWDVREILRPENAALFTPNLLSELKEQLWEMI